MPLGPCETRSVVFLAAAVFVGVSSLIDACIRRVSPTVIKFRFFSLMFTSMSLCSAVYEQQPDLAVTHGWFNMMGFAVAGLLANLYFLEVFVPMYSASAFERFDRSKEEYGWLFRWYSKSRVAIVLVTFILAIWFSVTPTNTVYLIYVVLAGLTTFFFAFSASLIVLRLGINVRRHRIASQKAEKDHAMFASKERTKHMRTLEMQLYIVSFVIGAFAFVSTLFGALHSIALSNMLSEPYVNLPCSLPNAVTEAIISICAISITRSPAAKPRKWAAKFSSRLTDVTDQKAMSNTNTTDNASKPNTRREHDEALASLEVGSAVNTVELDSFSVDDTKGAHMKNEMSPESSVSNLQVQSQSV